MQDPLCVDGYLEEVVIDAGLTLSSDYFGSVSLVKDLSATITCVPKDVTVTFVVDELGNFIVDENGNFIVELN